MPEPNDTEDFRGWLIDGGYSPKTASSYAGAIRNKLSEFAVAHGISSKSLTEYYSIPELRSVTNQIREHVGFLEFNKTGNYMYSSAINSYDIYVNERTQHEAVEDILKVTQDNELQATSRKALIAARIGQGKFRAELIEKWNGCAVTGYTQHSLLIASHIKPWRSASNPERLDVFNGLLLLPNIDKAFDRNFISFSSTGEILISSQLQEPERLHIYPGENIKLHKRHQPYLEFHRSECFIR